jgi:DNA-binding transcriptional MerR regulator
MDILTTKDVLERFQIPYHRLAYLFASRRLRQVKKSSSGGRLYTERDVERIRAALEDIERSKRSRKALLARDRGSELG